MFYFTVKNYFFVFLGIEDKDTKKVALDNLKRLGDCEEIMNNGYVLTVTAKEPVLINKVREAATVGKDIAMVIRLESSIDASWRLKTDKSQYLDSIVDELNK